jgi:hypothetical protein
VAVAEQRRADDGVDVFVTHDAVFPGLATGFGEFKRLLRSLSRTDTILWCCRLNILISDSTKADPKDIQGHCIGRLFDDEAIARINRFGREHGGRDNISVFFRGQLLEFIRWACLLSEDQAGDGDTFSAPEVRRNFARAALLASEVWFKRVYQDRFRDDRPIHDVRERVLSSIRRSNIETAPSPHPILAIARGASLFADRLPALDPEFKDVFRSASGLSIEDYLAMTAEIACNGLGKDVEGLRDPNRSGLFSAALYESAPAPMGGIAREFFQREAQTGDELRQALWGNRVDADEHNAPPFDLKPLRTKPIFRTADGRAIVIDPRSFAERASAGPLFYAVTAAPKHALRWFGKFGEVFEDYAQAILERIYPEAPPLVKRFTANPTARDQEGEQMSLGDGLLLAERTAVLFEIKGVWLKDSITAPDVSAPEYLAHVRERYGVTEAPTPGNRPVKGVGQLARSIRELAGSRWAPENVDLRDIDRVIPVLLVHDPHVDAPLHSHILAREFVTALEETQRSDWAELRLGRFRIAHLVVLTVDDLEALETSSRNFAVSDCFEQYTRTCPDRLVSFHNFLAYSAFRDRLLYNAWLASRSMEVLDYCMTRLYPGRATPGTAE